MWVNIPYMDPMGKKWWHTELGATKSPPPGPRHVCVGLLWPLLENREKKLRQGKGSERSDVVNRA